MLRRSVMAAVLLMLPGAAFAQTGYSITGGLSNFDCENHCDDPCDEMEIEIEGIHPEDVIHTYRNGNYGSPTVTLSDDGLYTIIDYRNPQHPTPVGSIEHFGVSLRQLSTANPIRVRWFRHGAPATVNGVVPNPGGGSTPATQPMLPSITADMSVSTSGGDGVSMTVTNNDPDQAIWIQRRAQLTTGIVTLEALMPNNPVVTTAVQLDAAPVFLPAGASVTMSSDLVEVEDDQSVVFAAEYFQDLAGNGPFNNTHVRGPALGNVMTATITSPEGSCDFYSPVILEQPESTDAPEGRTINLRVNADGNDLDLTYQWMKEGVALTNDSIFSGVDTDELSIEELTPAEEGFYSVRIFNACGSVTSNSALVFITGHNVPPVHNGGCIADFNTVGGLTVQDIFDFLGAYFAGDTASDINSDGDVTVQDIFDFLGAYFAGCP